MFLTQCELVAPTIVKELANGLDPLKTCEKVKLCTNGTLSTFKETLFFFNYLCHSILMCSLHTLRSCNKWNLYNLCVRLINLFLCRVWTLIYNKHNFHVICNIILNSKENKFNLVMINCICKYCFKFQCYNIKKE